MTSNTKTFFLAPDRHFYLSVVEDWWRVEDYFPRGIYTTASSFKKALSQLRYRIAQAMRVDIWCVSLDPSDLAIA